MQFHRQIITKRLLFSWNSLIQTSTGNGFFSESLNLYSSMLKSGVHGNNFTFPFVVKSCTKLGSIRDGMKIHAHTFLLGFPRDIFVQTALIDMYSKCSNWVNSRQLFDEMPVKSLVTWNSMISAYCLDCQINESFQLLKQMKVIDLEPNSSTFVSVLSGCIGSDWALRQGLSIHCCVIKLGFSSDLILSNSIIGMYVRFDLVDTARSLFNSIEEKSTISWTTIIGGYVKMGDSKEAFDLFKLMLVEQVNPDSIAFANLVSMCTQVGTLLLASLFTLSYSKAGVIM